MMRVPSSHLKPIAYATILVRRSHPALMYTLAISIAMPVKFASVLHECTKHALSCLLAVSIFKYLLHLVNRTLESSQDCLQHEM